MLTSNHSYIKYEARMKHQLYPLSSKPTYIHFRMFPNYFPHCILSCIVSSHVIRLLAGRPQPVAPALLSVQPCLSTGRKMISFAISISPSSLSTSRLVPFCATQRSPGRLKSQCLDLAMGRDGGQRTLINWEQVMFLLVATDRSERASQHYIVSKRYFRSLRKYS